MYYIESDLQPSPLPPVIFPPSITLDHWAQRSGKSWCLSLWTHTN